MSMENMHQSCKKCNRDMRFEFSIRQDIWDKLPQNRQDMVLCIECFLEELESVEPNLQIVLSDFAFLGIVGTRNLVGILIDNPNVKTQ